MRFNIGKLSLVFLAGLAPYQLLTAQENPADFAGGTIITTNNEYKSETNTAKTTFLVNQTFMGTDGKFFVPQNTRKIDENVTLEEMITAITGEVYTPVNFAADRSYTSQTLTCSEAEDRCYGCMTNCFTSTRRIRSETSRELGFQVCTRMVVKPTQRQPVLALPPSFYGRTWLEFEPGKSPVDGEVNSYDIKSFISGDPTVRRPFSCSLRAPNSIGSGIEANPCAGGFCLNVSQDCKISWNTSGAQVGEKYAFQVRIQETGNHYCQGYSDVDFLAEIGCASGDFACLQCSDIDVTQVLAAVRKNFGEQVANTVKTTNKNFKLLKKRATQVGKKAIQKRQKRTAARFQKRSLELDQVIINTLSSQPAIIQNCLRPSRLFCQRTDMSTVVSPIIAAAQEVAKSELKAFKQQKRLMRALGKRGPNGPKRKGEIQARTTATVGALGPLNGMVNQCNFPQN